MTVPEDSAVSRKSGPRAHPISTVEHHACFAASVALPEGSVYVYPIARVPVEAPRWGKQFIGLAVSWILSQPYDLK